VSDSIASGWGDEYIGSSTIQPTQPAASDNGTALGAAFYVWHQVLGQPHRFALEYALWGPALSDGATSQE
jgi:predicted NodU family carbamoyl transferase